MSEEIRYAVIKDALSGKSYLMRPSRYSIDGTETLIQPVDISSEPVVFQDQRTNFLTIAAADSFDLDGELPWLWLNAHDKSKLVVQPVFNSPGGAIIITPIVKNVLDALLEKETDYDLKLRDGSYYAAWYKYDYYGSISYNTINPTYSGEVGWSNAGDEYRMSFSYPMPFSKGAIVSDAKLRFKLDYSDIGSDEPLSKIYLRFLIDPTKDPFSLTGEDHWDDSLWSDSVEFDPSSWSKYGTYYFPDCSEIINQAFTLSDDWPEGRDIVIQLLPGPRLTSDQYEYIKIPSWEDGDDPTYNKPWFSNMDWEKREIQEIKGVLETKRSASSVDFPFKSASKYPSPMLGWDLLGADKVSLHVTGIEGGGAVNLYFGVRN
jgi:hypothetical protein